MTENLAPELFAAAKEDFAIYMALAHETDAPWIAGGKAIPATHHKRMIDVLMDEPPIGPDRGQQLDLIVAPRDSAKTTIVSGWLEWRLGRAKEELGKNWANDWRVGYGSASARQAYKISNAIKMTIEENDVFKAVFPHVKPHPNKWSEPEWKVKGSTIKDPNFMAAGVQGPFLGSRALILVFDDIADEDNMRSPLERSKLRFWLDKTAMPILVPWGRGLMVGTRWHDEDAVAWAKENGWNEPIYMKALDENDQSYWPERYSAAALMERRAKNPISFALQYQNEVVPYEGILFKREWFRNRFHYPPSPEDIFRVVATWDTAGTVTGRSYSVGLVVAITKDFRYFILHMLRDKLDYPSLKKAIRETHRIWHCSTTVIEEKSTGQPAIQELRLENLNVVGVLPPGQRGGPNEFTWAETVTVPCEEGRVWLPSPEFMRRHAADDWTEDFLHEVLAYDEGTHSDIVPALTQLIYQVEMARPQLDLEDSYRRLPALSWGRSEGKKVLV